MPRIGRLLLALGCACCAARDGGAVAGCGSGIQSGAQGADCHWPRGEPADRRLSRDVEQYGGEDGEIRPPSAQRYTVIQAQTSAADVQSLVKRVGVTIARSGQITPSMHVLYLPKTLYGGDVVNALAALRADPAVQFATVDGRRYALQTTPNDPLFPPNA